MPTPIVECVPNFSEGRDPSKIKQITDAVESVAGVQLLDVDPGRDANRTVVTFIGPPQAVAEAAFRAIAKSAQVIDMRTQSGSHPRLGATDVCPFVPVEGITLEDCAEIARQVGRRVGEELQIPVFLYEAAAASPERRNLADIRKGEYEGLADKLKDPRWQPDFGPASFNPKPGATVIGAREFLIAYNITLNTRDKAAASDIALELREKGRVARSKSNSLIYSHGKSLFYQDGCYPCGNCDFTGKTFGETEKHCREIHHYDLRRLTAEFYGDAANLIGQKVPRPGKFPFCKAIGWYAPEYRRAQISINLTNYHVTPPHAVLEETRRLAAERGLVVTGSEVVGMIPFRALYEAGAYYLRRQGRSPHVPLPDVLETAVFSLGLNDVTTFNIQKKVIGMPLRNEKALVARSVKDFADEVSRDTPAPGGGSVAALAGALGALAAMVANLNFAKTAGDAESERRILRIAEKVQAIKDQLLSAVDEDAEAFNGYLEALRLPSQTSQEKQSRERKIQEALQQAVKVPFQTATLSCDAMQSAGELALSADGGSFTDAAVGCMTGYAGVRGGVWNVQVNLRGITDPHFVKEMQAQCTALHKKAQKILQNMDTVIDKRLSEEN